jgi:4-alpha-glucanotransferase
MTEKRSAGILAHITSLPSAFGVGDVGPQAYRFVDFLYRSRQHYWQLLPLTPVVKEQAFSPYSPVSSMAGNTWLISPELLLEEGLLKESELTLARLPASDKVDYQKVLSRKSVLFEKAYTRYRSVRQEPFEAFCHREAYWLDDFALFVYLKEHYRHKPWHQWPEGFRHRELKNLLVFTAKHQEEIQKIKWLQFIFFKQWKSLKSYCHEQNIDIIGDLPFYISHNSVDVWSKPELFALGKTGAMAGLAGVPPDYFNENGQLWGMPVYRWEVMKEQRYDWWIKRLRKNMEMTDLVRLDHFRAFSDYWEVPAGKKTAIKGEWKTGPGASFFSVLQQEFGKLPFIAEDLGDISASVYELRDEFRLPGMKVLQFAVGDALPQSDHIPHNFSENSIAYTGTHDNNTTRGWFRSELKKKNREQLSQYTGISVSENNVHHVLARMAYASVAKTVILPIQDVLGLDKRARMNTPASTEKNWVWRLLPGQLDKKTEKSLSEWVELYGRG